MATDYYGWLQTVTHSNALLSGLLSGDTRREHSKICGAASHRQPNRHCHRLFSKQSVNSVYILSSVHQTLHREY